MSRLFMLTCQRNHNHGRDEGEELSAAAEIQSDLFRGLKRRPIQLTNFVDRPKIILVERCLKMADTLSIL